MVITVCCLLHKARLVQHACLPPISCPAVTRKASCSCMIRPTLPPFHTATSTSRTRYIGQNAERDRGAVQGDKSRCHLRHSSSSSSLGPCPSPPPTALQPFLSPTRTQQQPGLLTPLPTSHAPPLGSHPSAKLPSPRHRLGGSHQYPYRSPSHAEQSAALPSVLLAIPIRTSHKSQPPFHHQLLSNHPAGSHRIPSHPVHSSSTQQFFL